VEDLQETLLLLNVCQRAVTLALSNISDANRNFAHGKMWNERNKQTKKGTPKAERLLKTLVVWLI
jgi:hypothetical protein